MAYIVLFMIAMASVIIVALCLKEMWDWFEHGR